MRASIIALAITGSLLSGFLVAELNATPAAPPQTSAPAAVLELPRELDGPYVSDAGTMAILDKADPGGDCAKSGKLAFGCLVQARLSPGDRQPIARENANPFTLRVAAEITSKINLDLIERQKVRKIEPANQIDPNFLTDSNSRLELVGIVNRMDRQFVTEKRLGRAKCGEISLIYRFSYKIFAPGKPNTPLSESRLPVTMNVVLPAVPSDWAPDAASCKRAALRWQEQMAALDGLKTATERVSSLSDPEHGILPLIDGKDIRRIELNIQAFRKPADVNEGKFGSTAEYVIRVFEWDQPKNGPGSFVTSFLSNQIDRARFFDPKGDANSCEQNKGKPVIKDAFLAYLRDPRVVHDIDYGTLDIPQQFLACRAITASPGGEVRSGNNQFWDAPDPAQQILSDEFLRTLIAIGNARKDSPLVFIASPDDMRMRLNEQSCTGCHQTRAIAGFHFPGQDREQTQPSNAVLLAGSPHFYGDQLRRMIILDGLAKTGDLDRYYLRASFASRPLNGLRDKYSKTQLIGGWGGACLMPDAIDKNERKWTCNPGLACRQVYKSPNSPDVGVCLPPADRPQLGDPMQFGTVTSSAFGVDSYTRKKVTPDVDWDGKSTLISTEWLAGSPTNPYLASHQEYYEGVDPVKPANPAYGSAYYVVKRDSQTGGFPGGSLRLSECWGIPDEATCGLVASSGFNKCISQVGPNKTLADCFAERTSYAAMRACDVANPCRDDYICLKPMGYTDASFLQRQARVEGKIYDKNEFGQRRPDPDWVKRNDGRGVCIPPYFVFQFRADGHPKAH